MQTWGLSTLINILGCPNGPPPPSHSTTRLCVHRMGCLWIKPMAASGRGYAESAFVSKIALLQFTVAVTLPYLKLHNRLLESRSRHGLCPRILTPRPNGSSIRRLHYPLILPLSNTLLQGFILVQAFNWQLVRLRDIRNLLRFVWIVDVLLIVHGKGICAPGRNLRSS